MTQKGEAEPSFGDIRCHCGKLVARWDESSLLIKCNRCRRVVRIPCAAIQGKAPQSRIVEEDR